MNKFIVLIFLMLGVLCGHAQQSYYFDGYKNLPMVSHSGGGTNEGNFSLDSWTVSTTSGFSTPILPVTTTNISGDALFVMFVAAGDPSDATNNRALVDTQGNTFTTINYASDTADTAISTWICFHPTVGTDSVFINTSNTLVGGATQLFAVQIKGINSLSGVTNNFSGVTGGTTQNLGMTTTSTSTSFIELQTSNNGPYGPPSGTPPTGYETITPGSITSTNYITSNVSGNDYFVFNTLSSGYSANTYNVSFYFRSFANTTLVLIGFQ